ncbi:MAG TPA: hypothetical protein VHT31_03910, partial [Candidatus Acidoferrum sp.]|nr:hypothetical protein [Candidatus Acidoferrum sp.]
QARPKELWRQSQSETPYSWNPFFPFVSINGRKDCGQAPKGCKGRKNNFAADFFELTARLRGQCKNCRILAGRGFSHDLAFAKRVRLQILRNKCLNLSF